MRTCKTASVILKFECFVTKTYWEGNCEKCSLQISVLNIFHFSLFQNHFLERIVPLYRRTTEEELKLCPGNWKYGSYFTTLLTECTKFLPWSLER
jgi:hypothetical protein